MNDLDHMRGSSRRDILIHYTSRQLFSGTKFLTQHVIVMLLKEQFSCDIFFLARGYPWQSEPEKSDIPGRLDRLETRSIKSIPFFGGSLNFLLHIRKKKLAPYFVEMTRVNLQLVNRNYNYKALKTISVKKIKFDLTSITAWLKKYISMMHMLAKFQHNR